MLKRKYSIPLWILNVSFLSVAILPDSADNLPAGDCYQWEGGQKHWSQKWEKAWDTKDMKLNLSQEGCLQCNESWRLNLSTKYLLF